MRYLKYLLFALISLPLFHHSNAQAGEIYFNNGDKLTGQILSQDIQGVSIHVPGIGDLEVQKNVIEKVRTDDQIEFERIEKEKKAAVKYKGEISAGFDRKRGNTATTELTGEAKFHRITDVTEWQAKVRTYYSAENRKMNAQKYYGLLRYDHRFFEDKLFFTFGSLEYDRDRFANIDGRYTPGAGIGYWIFEEEDYKLQVEAKLGFTHTQFRDDTEDTTELVVVPRLYGEIKLFGDNTLSEEFKIYPSLSGGGDYRLYSETTFDAPISKNISIKFQFIDEYNSMPGGDAKENDTRLISKLAYKY